MLFASEALDYEAGKEWLSLQRQTQTPREAMMKTVSVGAVKVHTSVTDYCLQLANFLSLSPSLTPPVNSTFLLKGMGLYISSVHMNKTLVPESFVLYPAADLLGSM